MLVATQILLVGLFSIFSLVTAILIFASIYEKVVKNIPGAILIILLIVQWVLLIVFLFNKLVTLLGLLGIFMIIFNLVIIANLIYRIYKRDKTIKSIHKDIWILISSVIVIPYFTVYFARLNGISTLLEFNNINDVSAQMLVISFMIFMVFMSLQLSILHAYQNPIVAKNPRKNYYTTNDLFAFIVGSSLFLSLMIMAQSNILDESVLRIYERTYNLLLFISSSILIPSIYNLTKKQP